MVRTSLTQLALGLGILSSSVATVNAEELHLYNWTDSTSPELLQRFEAQTGIHVVIDVFDSNETALAKLKSGNGGYDLVDMTSDFAPIYIKEGLLQKVDFSAMPGFSNIQTKWKSRPWDPDNQYVLSWFWGTTSFIYDTQAYKGPVESLGVLFDPPAELQGKVGMLASPTEVMALGLVYLNRPQCSSNPADLKDLQALLLKQKPFVKVYSSDGINERMTAGEVSIHQEWSGDAFRTRLNRSSIRFVYAKEGSMAWAENLGIPTSARNVEGAKKFLAFLLQPENAALQSNFVRFQSTIEGADKYYDEKMKDAPEVHVPADQKLVYAIPCDAAAIRAYDKIWTKIKQ